MVADNISKKELQNLLEVVNHCAQCNTAAEFEERIKDIGSLVPYEMSVCANGNGHSRTMHKMVSNNFPRQYLQLYFDQNMLQHDPCINKSLELGKSHFYNIDNNEVDIASNKSYVSLHREFDLTHSLSSIFADATGKTTYLCLTSPTEKPHPRYLRVIDLLMPHLHHTMNRVYKTSDTNQATVLSNREIDVLKWLMEGKTNWEVSKILSISEPTVKFHLANIFRKLDVVNKGHAIAKTLQLGLITA